MLSNDAALEPSGGGGARLFNALAAVLAGLLAAALLAGLFDGGLPKPAHAEVAPAAAQAAPGLCFHGPGGELLDFAPAGGRCP